MDYSTFDNIIGYQDIKRELLRIMDRLCDPEKYEKLGVTRPRGLLLHGAPGVGKSTFANRFIEATRMQTFICRKDKPNGDFVKEIVRIFDQAAQTAPSIILLDDVDKFANEDERHRDAEEFVTVQACIDAIKDKQVFVIATANNIRKLPDSLIRAGRFDHVLQLNCPPGKDAEQIVAHYLAQRKYVANLDARKIARLLQKRSCAELEKVVNEAGVYAGYEGRSQIEMGDALKAILRVVFDAPETMDADDSVLELIACHEAGHAVIAELLEPGSVDMVSVLSHGGEIGGITSLYQDENYFYSKTQMENRVMCLLAGKAATELCYGTTDTGTISDLRRAFDIVLRFVDDYCSYGYDKFVFSHETSGELLSRREQQIASEMDRYYAQVKQMLVANRGFLQALITKLVEEKTVLNEQIRALIPVA